MGPERCLLCGEPIPEGAQICPICMQRYAGGEIDEKAAQELRDVADVLSITANTDGNIKRCMEAVIRIADRLERKMGNEFIQTESRESKTSHGKKKDKRKRTRGGTHKKGK